jgi:hypothetical protein
MRHTALPSEWEIVWGCHENVTQIAENGGNSAANGNK